MDIERETRIRAKAFQIWVDTKNPGEWTGGVSGPPLPRNRSTGRVCVRLVTVLTERFLRVRVFLGPQTKCTTGEQVCGVLATRQRPSCRLCAENPPP